jgi:hypothetical protein
LSLSNYNAAGKPAALLLCQALPHVFYVEVKALPQADMHDVPELLLRCLSIRVLTVKGSTSLLWAKDMLKSCSIARGVQRPSGPLAVHLPALPADVLQAARREWAFLCSLGAAPVTRVVVTGPGTVDLLAPAGV